MTQCDDSCQRIRLLFRIRLVHDPLIALACGARLICINARNNKDLVLDLFLYRRKAADIVADSLLVVG